MPNVTIEKLVFGGQALAHLDGKTWFVWNALPGEVVEATELKRRKGIVEAVATSIVTPSNDRRAPIENHYLCCSPWSILTPEAEDKAKHSVVHECFSRAGVTLPEAEMIARPNRTQYRNKMEYSFTADENGEPSLAFFGRGTHRLVAFDACALAAEPITEAAKLFVDFVRRNNWPVRSLKSLIVRCNSRGQVIVGLFIKDRLPLPPPLALPSWIIGYKIFYSDHRSPASTPDDTLATVGATELVEKIGKVNLAYGLFSFFQVNTPVFTIALDDIASFIDPGMEVVDYYAGVGTIGLALSKTAEFLTLVESNAEAHAYALKNIASNKLPNVTAMLGPSEHLLEFITHNAIVLVDPPRAGLDKRVIAQLIEKKPKRIVYLSCGPDTQARDVALLSPHFTPVFSRFYNFFPGTPHVESLVVLDRTSKRLVG